MGECSKETAFEMMDYFFEKGGNFIDTANNYQFEESETWIGEWMTARQNRDQIVLATKYTTAYPNPNAKNAPKWQVNYQGQHAKSLHTSVEASLKKLQTGYIDLLYVHWWDFTTTIEEVMQSLNHLVAQGKVLYLGISDTPAWVVSKANQYARDHGLKPFSVYQGHWSASERDFERGESRDNSFNSKITSSQDIIPMCREEGMALAPWGALGRGQFIKEEDRASKEGGRQMGAASDKVLAVSKAIEAVAARKNTLMTSIALAYVMHKTPYVFPIIGGRKVEHLKGNIEALEIELDEKDVDEIEGASDFDVGFPMKFMYEFRGQGKYKTSNTAKDIGLLRSAG